jgi:protein-S-isoprenylcysteine O-methyltransferase Ste14
MHALELKIPPPVVTLLVAGGMWRISRAAPLLELPGSIRAAVAGTLFIAGAIIGIAGVVSFRRAKTTVNPMKPESTSSLVNTGIYRYSRNPMYLGILFALVAWSVFLSSAWALTGPVAFVLYINRFQIAPEERVLLTMFGDAYSVYAAKVRRWL